MSRSFLKNKDEYTWIMNNFMYAQQDARCVQYQNLIQESDNDDDDNNKIDARVLVR